VAARPNGVPHRRRGDAAAVGHRLYAEPNADDRGVVSDQRPAAAVAPRGRVVLGHARRRRSRQQHARLAMDRRLRRRRGALFSGVQPDDAGGEGRS
jgi:hypothetical protein